VSQLCEGVLLRRHGRPSTRTCLPPIRRRWCGCTACASGWSKGRGRCNRGRVEATSRSAPTAPSAGTGRWCAGRAASAGEPRASRTTPTPPVRLLDMPLAPSPPASGGGEGTMRPTRPRHPRRLRHHGRCARCRAGLIAGALPSAAGRRARGPHHPPALQALLDAVTSGQSSIGSCVFNNVSISC